MASVLALLVVSLAFGVLARRLPAFPENTPRAVNAVVLNLALPALVLRELHRVQLSPTLAVGAAMLWLQFGLAALFFWALRRPLGLSRGALGALILTGGLSNTSFVGLPVIEMVLGPEALGVGVFVDQLGSFLVMATLGITVAALASGGRADPKTIARKVVLFPPFIALAVALLTRGWPQPDWLQSTLDRLGLMLTPLALFSVGFQLKLEGLASRAGPLATGLAFKLVLAPLTIAAVLWATGAIPVGSTAWQVTLLECAMPPMVTGGILAAEYDLDPPLAAAMLGVGIPLSALTLAVAITALT
ncbi:MAG: AEC family transporter [Myxococcota bacterium]|nr:AEC family transporter [Myxococcota bacterium]